MAFLWLVDFLVGLPLRQGSRVRPFVNRNVKLRGLAFCIFSNKQKSSSPNRPPPLDQIYSHDSLSLAISLSSKQHFQRLKVATDTCAV